MEQLELFERDKNNNLDLNFCSIGNIKDFSVEICNRNEIVLFIENWHYSKNVNGLTTNYCFKLLDKEKNIIGAIIYGKIAMANVWKNMLIVKVI